MLHFTCVRQKPFYTRGEVILPVFRMMDGEDHPRVQVILFEGHQHSKLILAS